MSYKDKINFLIATPYTCSQQDDTDIQTGKAQKKEWSDEHYKNFKSSIKKHLRRQQKNRCGFCRLRINNSQFYPHLEHIVPKKTKPDFQFLPINLVLSCQRCNFGKGVANTLTNNDIEDYPTTSNAFIIVNPYFDDFSEFIDLIEDLIFVPIGESNKGEKTIELYDLNRIELAEDRACELKTMEDNLTKEQLIGRLTLRLTKENDERIIHVIERHLENIEDWIIE